MENYNCHLFVKDNVIGASIANFTSVPGSPGLCFCLMYRLHLAFTAYSAHLTVACVCTHLERINPKWRLFFSCAQGRIIGKQDPKFSFGSEFRTSGDLKF